MGRHVAVFFRLGEFPPVFLQDSFLLTEVGQVIVRNPSNRISVSRRCPKAAECEPVSIFTVRSTDGKRVETLVIIAGPAASLYLAKPSAAKRGRQVEATQLTFGDDTVGRQVHVRCADS